MSESSAFSRGERKRAREVPLSIEHIRKIAEGSYAYIYAADVVLAGVHGEKARTFVLKDYSEPQKHGRRTPEQYAKYSFQMHTALKKAGVDTWTTYRLESAERKNRILITHGSLRPGDYIVSGNESDDKNEIAKTITTLSGYEGKPFETVLDEALENMNKALTAGLYISADAWTTQIRMGEGGAAQIKFFIGDFDEVTRIPKNKQAAPQAMQEIRKDAHDRLAVALYGTLLEILSPQAQATYIPILRRKIPSQWIP